MKIRYLATRSGDIFLTSQHKDLTSQHKDLTRRHKDLTSQHNNLTRDGRSLPPYGLLISEVTLYYALLELPLAT